MPTRCLANDVVAQMHRPDAAPTVDLIGRVRLDGGAGPVVAEHAGVHRRGSLFGGSPACVVAEARWYETALEWHARTP